MGDVLGYARVSTGDQDVAGQTMRLEQIGAIRVFTDVRSGKSMGSWPTPAGATPWRSSASTGSADPSRNSSPSSNS
jgi:hypothetical protein